MAKTYHRTEYMVKNRSKYVGGSNPIARSSWELTVFQTLDSHPAVVNWASEAIRIPYKNPLTGKMTIYIPDLLVTYIDAQMNKHSEIIEIKPISQSTLEKAKSRYDKISVVINQAKWAAARYWCSKNGFMFRVMSERDIFK